MLESLTCPNCQAALSYDAAERPPTLRCDYCGSTIIVPSSLGRQAGGGQGQAELLAQAMQLLQAGKKIEAIKLVRTATGLGLKEAKELADAIPQQGAIWLGNADLTHVTGQVPQVTVVGDNTAVSRRAGCIIFAVLMLIFVGVGGALLFSGVLITRGVTETVGEMVTLVEEIPGPTAAAATAAAANGAALDMPEPTPTPGFATLLRQFGGQEGIGPGFFNDTRRIAVDGSGTIYTGDYTGGRIQAFDASGQFLRQWQVDPEQALLGLAASPDGTVYVAQRGEIRRYDGATGQPLEPLTDGRIFYRTLAAAPDGSLVAVARDRLTRFDARGAVTLDVADPFGAVPDFATTHDGIAVDGAGSLYLLGSDTVYVFDANGRFVNRIGSEGDAPDQFRTSPTAIAVDGRGRVYANDFDGIKVFDANGRFLALIPLRGVTFGMLVTPQNELLVMDRNANTVFVYQPNP